MEQVEKLIKLQNPKQENTEFYYHWREEKIKLPHLTRLQLLLHITIKQYQILVQLIKEIKHKLLKGGRCFAANLKRHEPE